MLDILSDIVLGIGALGAGAYCYILGLRLKRLRNMEEGMGAAVSVLAHQVSQMSQTLERTKSAASLSAENLEKITDRAESSARRLELLIASLHDLPKGNSSVEPVRAHAKSGDESPTFLRGNVSKSRSQ